MDLTEALDFIRDRKQGVLATIRSNGRPQLSNILYLLGDDGVVRISVTDDRAKTKNLRRDPRASLYVLGDNFYQYVVIEATAELMPVAADPHDATVEALVAYYREGDGRAPRLGRLPGVDGQRQAARRCSCAPSGPTGWSHRADARRPTYRRRLLRPASRPASAPRRAPTRR